MDNNLLPVINTFFLFISSTISILSDILILSAVFFLFYKIFKTKDLASVNNREIFEHDKILVELKEEMNEIKHG